MAFCGAVVRGQAVFEGLEPLQWAREPHAALSHTAAMAAEVTEAPGAMEYAFECTEGGAPGSGWQQSPEYLATGLEPETVYTFAAQVRPRAGGRRLRGPSRPVAVTTPPADKHDRRLNEDVELVPLMVNGDKDNRLNIVIVNRWTAPERERDYNRAALREEFLEDARHVLRGMTRGDTEALEPFVTLRSFFNVYALWWPACPPWNPKDRQNGLHWEDYNALRDRMFLPWQREGRGWVTHLAMLNSGGGGGGAGRKPDRRIGDAMIAGNKIQDFFHEFSHTALGLGDKYIGWGVWGGASASDESPVATRWPRRERVRWRAWIEPDTPIPTPYDRKHLRRIGVFEGATHRLGYIFRATPACIMSVSQFREGLCPVCVQRAVQRAHRWVDVFDAVDPVRRELTLREPGRARFGVTRVKPEPDTHRVEWRLNGKLIATGTDEVEVDLGTLSDYTLSCSVVDETALIRPEPPYSEYPRAETSWHITNPKPRSQAAPLRVTLKPADADCWGRDSGSVVASVSGGKPPYAYEWSEGGRGPRLEGLAPGPYRARVTDSEFRHATAETEVNRPLSLTVNARSRLRGGSWRVGLDIRGDDPDHLTCGWSTGATGLVVEGVPDGTYRYDLTHRTGATTSGEVSLAVPARPLQATVRDIVPSTGENNGQVRLDVHGGRAPYRFAWSDDVGSVGAERLFLRPGRYTVVVSDANLTAVEQTITVGDERPFVLDRPRFGSGSEGTVRVLDPEPGFRYIWYDRDLPVHVMRPPRGLYEGTFTTTEGRVVEASGAVIPASNGKWITETEKHRNDFSSWVRLDAYPSGFDALPKTVKLKTDHDGRPGVALELAGDTTVEEWLKKEGEEFLRAQWRGRAGDGRLVLTGTGPDGGRFDLYYSGFHEDPARALHVGTEFRPPAPGNYYVAARRLDTGAQSANRVGVAIAMGVQPPAVEPLRPDRATGAKLLLWLDASDMDADGEQDDPDDFWTWERGILHGWKGKAAGVGFGIMHYLPNAQNGKPVCDFRYLWLQQTTQPVPGVRTVVMAYREHDLSEPGTSPWRGAPLCFWDLRGRPDVRERIPATYRQATAYLNGQRVDPFATPAPLDRFCVATFELPDPGGRLHRTDTRWEGAIAETVVYDGQLGEAERQGVEEYLRRKWIAEVVLAP